MMNYILRYLVLDPHYFFDDLGYFTNIKTFKITKGISFYLTKFTSIVSKFLTKIFHVAIGTHTVAAIGCALAVNLLIRIAKTLYMIIKNYYGEKINLLKIDVVAEHKVNPILSKYRFEKTDTVEYKNNPITGKIKYDKTELVEFNNNPIICDSNKENEPKKNKNIGFKINSFKSNRFNSNKFRCNGFAISKFC